MDMVHVHTIHLLCIVAREQTSTDTGLRLHIAIAVTVLCNDNIITTVTVTFHPNPRRHTSRRTAVADRAPKYTDRPLVLLCITISKQGTSRCIRCHNACILLLQFVYTCMTPFCALRSGLVLIVDRGPVRYVDSIGHDYLQLLSTNHRLVWCRM